MKINGKMKKILFFIFLYTIILLTVINSLLKYQTKNALTKEKKLNPSISIKFLRIVDNNINDKQIDFLKKYSQNKTMLYKK